MLDRLLNARINIIGTIFVSILASATTVLVSNLVPALVQKPQPIAPIATASSVTDCDQGIYSPIQRICVEQEVFDAEMKRLFAALGIETSAYNLGE